MRRVFGGCGCFFAKFVGNESNVYIFDPLTIHGEIINKNSSQNNLSKQAIYVPAAIGEAN